MIIWRSVEVRAKARDAVVGRSECKECERLGERSQKSGECLRYSE